MVYNKGKCELGEFGYFFEYGDAPSNRKHSRFASITRILENAQLLCVGNGVSRVGKISFVPAIRQQPLIRKMLVNRPINRNAALIQIP